MGRPPLPIGAHGAIQTSRSSTGWEARTRFRAADGNLQRLKRTRLTKTAAVNAVKAAVVELAEQVTRGELTGQTRVREVAELWWAEIELQVAEGRKSPRTSAVYRSYLDQHILPAVGELRVRELSTVRCEALMVAKRRAGARDDKLRGIRNVLSSVAGYAVRHGALSVNPVRELPRLQRVEQRQVRALTGEERADLLAKLDADRKAREKDLPDLLRGLLATGVRVSELLGCCGDDVLLGEVPKLVVAHRTTRVTGQGVLRRPRTGGTKGREQTLWIPAWSVPLFRSRKLASGGGPLWPTPFGEWRGVESVTAPLREALDRAGYEWVTSHVMRKTVAKVLKEAGIPVRQIADQLGQASTAVTEAHYLEWGASNAEQVLALERMMD